MFPRMNEGKVLGRHISEFADILGIPVTMPDRPSEGDPDYGLSRYLELPDRGCSIVIDWDDDVATCVQLFSGEKDPEYKQYRGALPCGLTFNSIRDDVRRALGEPVQYNNGGGQVPMPWDWFLFEGHKIHFEYRREADGVLMVSLETAPTTP
jgi:hypothetical protein